MACDLLLQLTGKNITCCVAAKMTYAWKSSLLLLLGLVLSVCAVDIVVNGSGGSTADDCGREMNPPCATIAAGLVSASSGDTLIVQSGEYEGT